MPWPKDGTIDVLWLQSNREIQYKSWRVIGMHHESDIPREHELAYYTDIIYGWSQRYIIHQINVDNGITHNLPTHLLWSWWSIPASANSFHSPLIMPDWLMVDWFSLWKKRDSHKRIFLSSWGKGENSCVAWWRWNTH